MATFSQQLDYLAKIQTCDTRMRELKTALNGVPGHCDQLTRRLETQKAAVAERKETLDALKKDYRERDGKVKDLAALVARSNRRLHEVKTNKEYESVLKEIDDVKRHISEIEDRMIEDLDAIDAAETAVARAEAELNAARGEIESEIETVNQRAAADQQRLGELQADASRLSADVDADLMRKYRYVQGRKPDGVAVCEVIDAVCQGCRLSIPQQIYYELQRRDALHLCPKCERIIYWVKRI